MSFIPQLLGLIVIICGVVAIFRRSAKASAEGEDEREYRGSSAVILGIVWIVLGVTLVLFPNLIR